MKQLISLAYAVILAITFAQTALPADKASQSPKTGGSNFIMLTGSVSGIDMTDPSNVKIDVKDARDNQVHTMEVTPSTNVTKATSISELKVGDNVRVMARKAQGREVAIGVMFGNLRNPPERLKKTLENPKSPASSPRTTKNR